MINIIKVIKVKQIIIFFNIMKLNEFIGYFVKIVNGISLPFYFLSFIIIYKKNQSLFRYISLQLVITSLIQSVAFLLPSKDNDFFCKMQTALDIIGDISKITVATSVVLFAQLNFMEQEKAEKRKTIYIVGSIIFSWVIPITITILFLIFGKAVNYSEFCWISNDSYIFLYATSINRYAYIVIFIILFIMIIKSFKELCNQYEDIEIYTSFKSKMNKYAIILGIYIFVLIVYFALDLWNSDLFIYELLYALCDINNGLMSPIYVLVFLYDKATFILLKNILFCKQVDPSIERSSVEVYYTINDN